VLINLGEVHTKVVSKARRWIKGDESIWTKLVLGEKVKR
jgi:hypothetical protein